MHRPGPNSYWNAGQGPDYRRDRDRRRPLDMLLCDTTDYRFTGALRLQYRVWSALVVRSARSDCRSSGAVTGLDERLWTRDIELKDRRARVQYGAWPHQLGGRRPGPRSLAV